MSKIRLTIAMMAIFICFNSCKKNQENDGPGEIYGRWKLTETLADIGNGKGKYIKVKENKYLIISRTGEIEGVVFPDLTTFKIVDSVTIAVTSKTYNGAAPYRYKVTANTLTLNPPCIESCGLKFIKK